MYSCSSSSSCTTASMTASPILICYCCCWLLVVSAVVGTKGVTDFAFVETNDRGLVGFGRQRRREYGGGMVSVITQFGGVNSSGARAREVWLGHGLWAHRVSVSTSQPTKTIPAQAQLSKWQCYKGNNQRRGRHRLFRRTELLTPISSSSAPARSPPPAVRSPSCFPLPGFLAVPSIYSWFSACCLFPTLFRWRIHVLLLCGAYLSWWCESC